MYMNKHFNTTGLCFPDEHYMVNIEDRLDEIAVLVEQAEYFVINRARQYGKTTTLTYWQKSWRKNMLYFRSALKGWKSVHVHQRRTSAGIFTTFCMMNFYTMG